MTEWVPHDLLVQLSLAIGAGVVLVTLARRLQVPLIVLLLLGGIGLGPQGLGWIQPDALGPALGPLVSLAVGVILFEGGLTLDLRVLPEVAGVVRRLLTWGVLVTWLGTAAAIWAVFGHDPRVALLAGSLVIVTGPTVILPLLKRVQVQPRLHTILHWEGVLIDAIGVFIAILCYEWLAVGDGALALVGFAERLAAGLAVGLVGGLAVAEPLRRHWVPEGLANVFALGGAILVFGLTEALIPEAGLLSVTVAGLVVGWRKPTGLRRIREFKGELTDLLIGTLFVLLAARLEIARFAELGVRGIVLLGLVMLVVRPLNVLVSTRGAGLSGREKLFLSWIAPRGIVAASVASLFGLELAARGEVEQGQFLETFVYSVIATTVVLQGFSAGWVARWLGVNLPEPRRWVIVGAHRFARVVAKAVAELGRVPVTLIDRNGRLVAEARLEGYEAVQGDVLDDTLLERQPQLRETAVLLAMTDNAELNELAAEAWRNQLPKLNIWEWTDRDTEPESRRVHRLWPGLPRPGQLATELRREEAAVEIRDGSGPEEQHATTLLWAAAKGGTPHLAGPGAADDRRLVLVRRPHALLRALEQSGLRRVEAADFGQLLAAAIDRAVALQPQLEAARVESEVRAREALLPTYIGHGVALPHAVIAGLMERVVVLVAPIRPVAFPGADEAVQWCFLILSPDGDPEGHLEMLAEIARFMRKTDAAQRLGEFQTSPL